MIIKGEINREIFKGNDYITVKFSVDELMKNYEGAIKKAVKYANKAAVKDIYEYSMSCLEEYYDNYDPSSYKRTDSLWHAIVPCSQMLVSSNKKVIKSIAGVEYDPLVLQSYTEGNPAYAGSSHYDPDPWWVIDNYLGGIHPATNGATNENKVAYFEILDRPSPEQRMNWFLEDYAKNTFQKNILMSFAKQIIDMR